MVPLTKQQAAAIQTREVSVALSAGAGCGKTFVLTQRFLSHLEPGDGSCEVSGLVAITFTERAAREMRDRIRATCAARIQQCPPEDVPHWLKTARELYGARISTIHSFCASLLRSHAVEAGLDPRFGLLEETTTQAFLSNSVRTAIFALLARQDEDCIQLTYEFGLARVQQLVELLVTNRFQIVFDRWTALTPDELVERWQAHLRKVGVPCVLRELAASEVAAEVLALLRQNTPTHPKMQERRQILLEHLPSLEKATDPLATIQLLIDNARVQGGGTKQNWPDPDLYEAVKNGLTALRKELESAAKSLQFDETHARTAAECGLQLLRVTQVAAQAYTDAKQTAGLLDFDDLLLGARDLLRDAPDVLRRAASGISLLMVDEFQDTDPVQADLVRSLCGKDLLYGKLFLVGDAKQSIYRFRHAEPRVFHELRAEIPESGRLPLTTNFRSQPAILNFVNCLFDGGMGSQYEPLVPHFTQLSPEPVIEFLFSRPEESHADNDAAGSDMPERVAGAGADSRNPGADAHSPPENPAQPGDAHPARESADTRRAREADWIARRLQQLLNDGVPRIRERNPETGKDELRPVQARDIVILFRAMTDVRYYEQALRECHLDYYVVGGRAFYAQQEVYDVANLCQWLNDVDDELSLVGVLRSPFFSLSDDALFALSQSGQRLSDALREPPAWLLDRDRDQIRHAASVLDELRSYKNRLSIAQLLNLAIDRTGYDAALLAEFLGARKLANLRKLIDMARQFDKPGLFGLSDFVEQLSGAVLDETRESLAATHPESSNVIRLMSIHQSKGLEFPVVVVTDMDRKGNDIPPSALFDPQLGPLVSLGEKFGEQRTNPGLRLYQLQEKESDLAETIRLLYVATTRAADWLILSAGLQPTGRVSHPWMKLLASRFDLATGAPLMAANDSSRGIPATYARSIPAIRVHTQRPELVPVDDIRGTQRLPLRKFRETVEAAEPASPPDLLQPIPPGARRRFNVSEIEKADDRRRGADVDRAPVVDVVLQDAAELGEGRFRLNPDEASDLGDLVHAVLERIDYSQLDAVDAQLDRACRSTPREIGPEQKKLAANCIGRFLTSPPGKELPSAQRCFRELEFLLRWPAPAASVGGPAVERTITGKIDCLYQTASGEWVVLDYKTGSQSAGKAALQKLRSDYELQLGIYCLAAAQLLGKPPDRIELVGLRHRLQQVTFAPTPEFLADVARRIDRAIDQLGLPAGDLPPQE